MSHFEYGMMSIVRFGISLPADGGAHDLRSPFAGRPAMLLCSGGSMTVLWRCWWCWECWECWQRPNQ